MRVTPRIAVQTKHVIPSFYREHDLYKFDNKNVVYIAYVGVYNKEEIFKYGISSKIFKREYLQHRNNFTKFNMVTIKITDNKDIVEELFEKELLMRNLHRKLTINNKKQTELFTVNEDYSYEYIHRLLSRIIRDNPSYEVAMLKEKITQLKMQLKNYAYYINEA
jgi:hypothetical protein